MGGHKLRAMVELQALGAAAVQLGTPFAVTLEGEDDAKVLVPANETYQQRVYVEAAPDSEGATEERSEIRLWIANEDGTERVSHDTVFNGKDD